jgi:hypothetical protein
MQVVPSMLAQLLHPNDDRTQRVDRASPDRVHSFIEEFDRVAKPVPGLGAHDGGDGHVFAPLHQRKEATGEVSAVDCRNVAWKEWLQILRVVPIEEMPLVVSHARQAFECPLHAERQLAKPQVSEVVSRKRRYEHEADIRRRRTMGGLLARLFLVIVDG